MRLTLLARVDKLTGRRPRKTAHQQKKGGLDGVLAAFCLLYVFGLSGYHGLYDPMRNWRSCTGFIGSIGDSGV